MTLTPEQQAKHAARYATTLQTYEQCKRAFFQNPTPRLGKVLKALESPLRYLERSNKK